MTKKEMPTHYQFQNYLVLSLIDLKRWGAHSGTVREILTKKEEVHRTKINIKPYIGKYIKQKQ